jgi:hypothetical protein
MPFALTLPSSLHPWKVKIFDGERNEAPHATILLRRQLWRVNLRSLEFMDARPDPSRVPTEIIALIRASVSILRREWNAMNPGNPVDSTTRTE